MEPTYTPLTPENQKMLDEMIETFSAPLIGKMVVAQAAKDIMEGSAKAIMAPKVYLDGLLDNLPETKETDPEEMVKAVKNTRILLETLKEDRATFIAHLQEKGFDGEFMA